MTPQNTFSNKFFAGKLFFIFFLVMMMHMPVIAQERGERPKPLLLSASKDAFEERMQRRIALDVRDMNIVDVLKFLATKGEFNLIISPAVEGRITVLLDNVAIKDAMDIVVVSNKLAYTVQNSIIQVMTSVEYEAMFGKSFGDKTVVETFHLQYAKPSYVLAALDNLKSNVGRIIIDEDTGSVVLIDTIESVQRMRETINNVEKPLETFVYNLQYAKADVVADKLRMRIDAKSVGAITADERSNQLIVRVFPGRKQEVEKIIRHLDSPTKEVLIEARILQVMLKPTAVRGIDWSYIVKQGSKNQYGFSLNELSNVNQNISNGGFGQIFTGLPNFNDFIASIKLIEGVNDTKILSNPQILAVNNEQAHIHIGDTVPYIISTVSGTGENAITSEDVRFIDVGLKLSVTPTINDDGMVTMRLSPEISSVVDRITSNKDNTTGGIPQVNKTAVETTVVVEDGTTIIMAGLRKDDRIKVKSGIPGLRNLPILGKFFSSESDSMSSTEIVIFITPHIVTGKDSYKKPKGTIKPAKQYN